MRRIVAASRQGSILVRIRMTEDASSARVARTTSLSGFRLETSRRNRKRSPVATANPALAFLSPISPPQTGLPLEAAAGPVAVVIDLTNGPRACPLFTFQLYFLSQYIENEVVDSSCSRIFSSVNCSRQYLQLSSLEGTILAGPSNLLKNNQLYFYLPCPQLSPHKAQRQKQYTPH